MRLKVLSEGLVNEVAMQRRLTDELLIVCEALSPLRVTWQQGSMHRRTTEVLLIVCEALSPLREVPYDWGPGSVEALVF